MSRRTLTSSEQRAAARERERTARGYRIRDFCAREGISRSTCWNWARKGVVQVSRLGPAVGVRVEYAADDAWNE